MLLEGSCDTEDWSNGSAVTVINDTYLNVFKYKTVILNCYKISKYYYFFTVSKKCRRGEHKSIKKGFKTFKNSNPEFLWTNPAIGLYF